MPRYAIFSDIHGNLEALQAFEAHSRQQGADVYLCGGDIVGYGADPGACLDEVRRLCSTQLFEELPVILGNHDEAVSTGDTSGMNRFASEAATWTRNQLSGAHLAFLGALPMTFEQREELLLVHSAPYSPGAWNYIFDLVDIQRAADHFSHATCFVGHSHVPVIAEIGTANDPVIIRGEHISMRPEARYLANVGSVGQPRDSDPRGCYMIYDSDEKTLQRFRFEYDIAQAQEKILRAGLPPILAQRLGIGY